jgi:hypothetical protein
MEVIDISAKRVTWWKTLAILSSKTVLEVRKGNKKFGQAASKYLESSRYEVVNDRCRIEGRAQVFPKVN